MGNAPGSCVISVYKDGGVGILLSDENVAYGVPSFLKLGGNRLEIHQGKDVKFFVDGVSDENVIAMKEARYFQILNVINPGKPNEAFEVSEEVTLL